MKAWPWRCASGVNEQDTKHVKPNRRSEEASQSRRAGQTQDPGWTGNTSGMCPTVDPKRGQSRPNNSPPLPHLDAIEEDPSRCLHLSNQHRSMTSFAKVAGRGTNGPLFSDFRPSTGDRALPAPFTLWALSKTPNGPADISLVRPRCCYHLTDPSCQSWSSRHVWRGGLTLTLGSMRDGGG